MATALSTDEGLRFKPLPPPKKQRSFTTGRRSVKPASFVPQLNDRQASLTQMQWSTTPRRNIVRSSSDEDDEDYQPPTKRQKQNSSSKENRKKPMVEEREKGQDTYTQFIRRPKIPRAWRLDDDGFQMWQDADENMAAEDGEGIGLAADFSTSEALRVTDECLNRQPEIRESSANIFSDQVDDAPRPSPRKPIANQRTPQKVRFMEVPSSQTPPSTKRSTQRRIRAISRSPLKEKSANSSSPMKKMQSPESQMSMKMLERARFANQQAGRSKPMARPVDFQVDEDLEQCAAEAAEDFSLRTYQMPPPPGRNLHRNTTIQDSQADELCTLDETATEAMSPAWPRSGAIPDSQRNSSNETLLEDSQRLRTPRKLRRVATVQDSQFGDDDSEFEEGAISAENFGPHITNEDDEYERHELFPEGTFDPAFSALDRDAGRFTWTQTQRRIPDTVENSETEDEDLEGGSTTKSRQDNRLLSDRTSQELGEPLPLEGVSSTEHAAAKGPELNAAKSLHLEHGPQRDDSAYESGDQVATVQGIDVQSSPPALRPSQLRNEVQAEKTDSGGMPSSPPPLRASQVSTVVSTQFSMPAGPASPAKRIKDEPLSLAPSPHHPEPKTQAFSLLSSPQIPPLLCQQDSLDSSPLPLPPWSSPKGPGMIGQSDPSLRNAGLGSEPQMDSLADFSLPPPPPLCSSSRRQTPTSSSL